jgi:crotonobetainyl-CoA:carnitine CoA-transferase CaiB-like acyl-CoA transferase
VPNLQIGDLLGGAMGGVMGMLAALFDAQRSGQGRFVDVAMSDAALAHNLFPLFALQSDAGVAERGGDMLSGGDAGYGVYATADGRYMAVAPLEEKFWHLFCETLGRADWKPRHGEFGTKADELRHELESVFIGRTQAQWCELFAGVDCCVTPVLGVAEALVHPQFVARGMAISADGVTQYAPPIKLSGWAFSVERPAPSPGEHCVEILHEAGYSGEEIAWLRENVIV